MRYFWISRIILFALWSGAGAYAQDPKGVAYAVKLGGKWGFIEIYY
jgi:hypothetical protein